MRKLNYLIILSFLAGPFANVARADVAPTSSVGGCGQGQRTYADEGTCVGKRHGAKCGYGGSCQYGENGSSSGSGVVIFLDAAISKDSSGEALDGSALDSPDGAASDASSIATSTQTSSSTTAGQSSSTNVLQLVCQGSQYQSGGDGGCAFGLSTHRKIAPWFLAGAFSLLFLIQRRRRRS